MHDFQKSKIYKIVSTTNNNIYIGSTIQLLWKRMSEHRKTINKCASSLLGNINNCYIILISNYPCNNKEELRMEEDKHIQLYKTNGFDVVNKYSAYRTEEQKKTYSKEYNKKNKIEISIKQKEIKKKHYTNNKVRLTEQHKKYYKDNKDQIKEKRKKKYTCECGSTICKSDKTKHSKTKKHIIFLNSYN
jgi:hypothetical protein